MPVPRAALCLVTCYGLLGCSWPSRHVALYDADHDGVGATSDCDDDDPDVSVVIVYPDQDGDGYGTLDGARAGCADEDGFATVGTDCDDDDPHAWTVQPWFLDNDRDGWGAGTAEERCTSEVAGYASLDGDCNDQDPEVNPGAEAACDGADSDCDGIGECDPPDGKADASQAALTVAGDAAAEAGSALAGVGDVDGDGQADVAIGAPGYDDGRGALLVVQGAPEGTTTVAHPPSSAVLLTGAMDGDRLGSAITGGVSFDDDAYADLLVAAPFASGSAGLGGAWPRGSRDPWPNGRVYVLVGPLVATDGSVATYGRAAALEGPEGGMAGWSLACDPGTHDADAWGCAVGVPLLGNDDDAEEAGAVYLVTEPVTSDGDLEDAASAAIGSAVAYDRLGTSVAVVGDVSGDGVGDFYVGAPTDVDLVMGGDSVKHATKLGAGYLLLGGIAGDHELTDAAWTSTLGAENEAYGALVAGGGDLDGDGVPDVLVGAPFAASGKGRMDVLSGALLYPEYAGLGVEAAVATIEGSTEGDQLGTSGAVLEDLDGDDLAEAGVGAPGLSSARGGVGLYYGPLSGALTLDAADWTVTGLYGRDRLGHRVASAGDVNGLGWPELLVGGAAAVGPSGETEADANLEGNAWLFHTDAW